MAIDTSLNSASSTAGYGYGASSAAGGAPSSQVSGSGGVVASSDNPVAVEEAVQLAANASVVVSLGNSIGTAGGLTYNAVGLFDAIIDAGAATNTSTDETANQASQSLYQGILGSLTTDPSTAGIYNGSGEFTGLDSGLNSQLSSLLKSNPDLTDTIVGDLATQGIVGTLFSTTA
ncbi:hypothetical protein J8I26_16635 [Herbaspirillum sp. LeCh32-8]|uniref:hypothetical protein n=1 Tax=Herbaspirillum sp. LeCh32-8 TaxID=2821356 RepID=UPI001AE61A31|nr:hypothetical protein [Herbaspirillum sp. LeCh32-8]MBP0599742.1 hypothetical protein [Herbaspirillum sp. LeCh32-8]